MILPPRALAPSWLSSPSPPPPPPPIPNGSPASAPPPRPPGPAPCSPDVLPGNALSQHLLYAGEWDHKNPSKRCTSSSAAKSWSYAIPSKDHNEISEFSDATLLSDNSVVFSEKTGAGKITADKKLVWDYQAPKGCEVHACQPIGKDRVLFIQNGRPAKLVVLNLVTGKTETEFPLATNPGAPVHTQFRRARMTAAGTFLVPHKDLDKVVEYDAKGKELWSVNVPVPWSAVRLKSGNTLVSSGSTQVIREFTPAGKVVWQFTQSDVPTIPASSASKRLTASRTATP